MDETSPPIQPEESPKTSFPVAHSHKLTYGYLMVLVFAAIVGAVYAWQHDKVNSLQKQLASVSASRQKSTNSSSVSTVSAITYTKDVGAGYPLSMPNKKVLTTMYLTAGTDVLQSVSSLSTQADLNGVFVNDENDILGYWIFMPQGTLSSPSDSLAPTSNIYMTDMADWEKATDTTPVIYPAPNPPLTGTKMTIAQKQSYIANLKTQTDGCAADNTKGFSTNDKTYDICYSLLHPQAEDGNYIMYISGFGTVNSDPIYIGGEIQLPNSYQTMLSSYINSLKNITTVVQDNSKP